MKDCLLNFEEQRPQSELRRRRKKCLELTSSKIERCSGEVKRGRGSEIEDKREGKRADLERSKV
jgi:hypothetical protein